MEALKERYVTAVLIEVSSGLSTGAIAPDALEGIVSADALIELILRLGLADDLPEHAPEQLREITERWRLRMLNPAFRPQPLFEETGT